MIIMACMLRRAMGSLFLAPGRVVGGEGGCLIYLLQKQVRM